MRMVRGFAVLLVAVVAAGCLSVESNIKVRPDGTGTIEQTMLVNSSAMGMMTMMGGGEDGAPKTSPEEMFSDAKLREDAARFGEGVTYVSHTKVSEGEMSGVKAIYSFTDFNQLKVTATPPDLGGEAAAGPKLSGSGSDIDMVLSRKGTNGLITLDMFADKAQPRPKAPAGEDAGGNPFGDMPKEMMGMLAPMFKGMRVAVSVEPEGQLVRTNAKHVDGNRVTILDLDFGELLSDPSGFEKMEALGSDPSMEQISKALAGVKGIKVNDVERLEIEFR